MNPLAVVTGGTKGIGRAAIEKFLAQGFDVITCARNESDLLALQQTFSESFPQSKLTYLTADLSVRADVDAFITFIHKHSAPVEVLINNTGVFIPGQVHNETEGTLEKTMETNLYSAYHLTRGILPGMMGQQKGHIFTICSTASIIAYPNGGSYCISKFALYGMTKVLREEMKPHKVRVTAILPGATYTDSWKGTELPEDRFMDSGDVAESIWAAYALSPRAVVEEILIRPQLGDLD
ncbi:short-subunit dehydrogenase [Dyadobacter sp. BE34]|uniref:Short-subunit dehydrogenase n=1 Tax=Dyadobacter fermentans TaxID=94254 RepID=A0ABU1R940_9BACT|nr:MULTISPECIES: SDR family oxidoreductase [Dyadobacter]MDR6809409.1 short-subunit dehydrogenase [Dyadobacter fermentans]MDR7046997.1 short-subunit dehydrogenase [Dyadobacter sp. BE242]MDR7195036.1 short-subunit dehydrogenase [Dyadobacter sp. BE34]MDR7214419.1 short-subunit dehydrogenase [Dyadobacter sp. BE31]MDR7266958.1 short-subunit dehydrogenase [Dyadobacter sp. BE32]